MRIPFEEGLAALAPPARLGEWLTGSLQLAREPLCCTSGGGPCPTADGGGYKGPAMLAQHGSMLQDRSCSEPHAAS